MSTLPYTLGPWLGHRAALGLIVLQSDETIEADFRRLIPFDGVSLYATRIPSAPEVSRETLAAMEGLIPQSATLLPPPVAFDAVGYGCTSAASVIGPARVAQLIQGSCQTRAVTEPLSALVAACRALGVTRLGLLSPYVAPVSQGLRDALGGEGIDTPVFASFDEAEETRVARIDAASLSNATRHLAQKGGIEAVFMSCTNLRTLDVIAPLEMELGLPVLSSNQALAWHMMRLAGLPSNHLAKDYGQLFSV